MSTAKNGRLASATHPNTLMEFEQAIHKAPTTVSYTTAGLRKWSDKQPSQEERVLRDNIRAKAIPRSHLKESRKLHRKLVRARRRKRSTAKLAKVNSFKPAIARRLHESVEVPPGIDDRFCGKKSSSLAAFAVALWSLSVFFL